MNSNTTLAEKAQARLRSGIALAEEAGEETMDRASAALHAGERKASATLGSIAASVEELRRSLPSAMHRAADEVRGAGRVTAGYVRDEPLKSALIAVAAGALVIGILTMFNRRRY
jgi:ElaB/YqjD/DUF883 family membrane-anchored ribosome-binding protein